jgi:SAM-dependent methyltransferase
MPMQTCPLCRSTTEAVTAYRDEHFFICGECGLYFRDPEHLLDPSSEKQRYQMHNNDVNDPGYQRFVSPVVNAVLEDMSSTAEGLDFGAGTGPVISKMLHDRDYRISQYDPFFHPYDDLLEKQYDYIVCCEVMEHFYDPAKEFKLLRSLLKPNGRLYCMTGVFTGQTDFRYWTYKNDPTHVSIYQIKTLEWIRDHYDFLALEIEGRLAAFIT